MGERQSDSGSGEAEAVKRPHVVLVLVECVCAPEAVAELELLAAQWAQDLRFRRVMHTAETTEAQSVVVPGSMGTFAEMMRVAHERVTT